MTHSTAPRPVRLTVFPADRMVAAPGLAQQLVVAAEFADGSRRDVTREVAYDVSDPTRASVTPDGRVEARGPVEVAVSLRYLGLRATSRLAFLPDRPDFAWEGPEPANVVDVHVFAKLKALKINPSPPADDAAFLRRAFLDALGVLPTPEEARAFLADRDPEKRAKLVEGLPGRPEFADFWALKWADLLRNEEKSMGDKGVWVFMRWLRDQMARDVPLDEFARSLVASRGSTYLNPPTSFYRTNRDPQAAAEAVGQVFLGVRLQCARCHNHPFDRWTQDDYYGLAAYFGNLARKQVNLRPPRPVRQAHDHGRRGPLPGRLPRDDRPPDRREDRPQAPRRPEPGARRRPRCARRPGRLADARQPAVRPQHGQPGLVPPHGPGDRRAGGRLPRQQPAVESRPARRPDGRVRPGRDAAPPAGDAHHEVADLRPRRQARAHQPRRRGQLRACERPPPAGRGPPRRDRPGARPPRAVPRRPRRGPRRAAGGGEGGGRFPQGLRQAGAAPDLRMRALRRRHAGASLPAHQRRGRPGPPRGARQPHRPAPARRGSTTRRSWPRSTSRRSAASRATPNARGPWPTWRRPRTAARRGKTWPGRS